MTMKITRKLELLLEDIRSLLADSTRSARDYSLPSALWDLVNFKEELSGDAAKTRAVLEIACRLRVSNAPGRQVAEERLMGTLADLARACG